MSSSVTTQGGPTGNNISSSPTKHDADKSSSPCTTYSVRHRRLSHTGRRRSLVTPDDSEIGQHHGSELKKCNQLPSLSHTIGPGGSDEPLGYSTAPFGKVKRGSTSHAGDTQFGGKSGFNYITSHDSFTNQTGSLTGATETYATQKPGVLGNATENHFGSNKSYSKPQGVDSQNSKPLGLFWLTAAWGSAFFILVLYFAYFYRDLHNISNMKVDIALKLAAKAFQETYHSQVSKCISSGINQIKLLEDMFDYVHGVDKFQKISHIPIKYGTNKHCNSTFVVLLNPKQKSREEFTHSLNTWASANQLDGTILTDLNEVGAKNASVVASFEMYNSTFAKFQLEPKAQEYDTSLWDLVAGGDQYRCGWDKFSHHFICTIPLAWQSPSNHTVLDTPIEWFKIIQINFAAIMSDTLDSYSDFEFALLDQSNNVLSSSFSHDVTLEYCSSSAAKLDYRPYNFPVSLQGVQSNKLRIRVCTSPSNIISDQFWYVYSPIIAACVILTLYVFSRKLILGTSIWFENKNTHDSQRFFTLLRQVCQRLHSDVHSVLYFSESAIAAASESDGVGEEFKVGLQQCLNGGRGIRSLVNVLTGMDTLSDLEKLRETLAQGTTLNESVYAVSRDVIARVRVNLTYLDSNISASFHIKPDMKYYYSTQTSYYLSRLLLLGFSMALEQNPSSAIVLNVQRVTTEPDTQKSDQDDVEFSDANKGFYMVQFSIICCTNHSKDSSRIESGLFNDITTRWSLHRKEQKISSVMLNKVQNVAMNFKSYLHNNLRKEVETKRSPSTGMAYTPRDAQILKNRSFFVRKSQIAHSPEPPKEDQQSIELQLGQHLADTLNSKLVVTHGSRGMWSFVFTIETYRDEQACGYFSDGNISCSSNVESQFDDILDDDSDDSERGNSGKKFDRTSEVSVSSDRSDDFVVSPEDRKALRLPSGLTVLHCDDDAASRLILKRMMGQFGVEEVLSLESGEELLNLVSQSDFIEPDIVLLDIVLIGIQGDEVLTKLREKFPTFKAPVIAVTGHSRMEYIQKLLSIGFHRVVVKPYSKVTIYKQILGVLQDIAFQPGTKKNR